ncbi:DUF5655 domain-containing protein [Streptomyces virginiae]|uniref:DUF5655 domain-containing protein n=1 Tax=Streptomyces virginiae TaxID=1961 RepID=UPI00365AE225
MAWLVDHRDAFRHLVRDRLGVHAAAQVLWSAPRLICVAGDFTRYDIHAVREHRHAIDLVRYRYFGSEHFGLETVASVAGRAAAPKAGSRSRSRGTAKAQRTATPAGAMAELAAAVDEVLLGLGEDLTKVSNQTYTAYRRMQNYACLVPPKKAKLLVYLKADPAKVDLVPGFARDVTGLGHHGTGDLELTLQSERDLERAAGYFRESYAVA